MIKDLFAEKKQLLSFEVFPPKKEDEFANAFAVLDSLAGLQPDFISVTYGAGGSKSKNRGNCLLYTKPASYHGTGSHDLRGLQKRRY